MQLASKRAEPARITRRQYGTRNQQRRQQFVAAIQQHAGGEPNARFSFAQRLMRYSATYGRIQEHECNAPDARYGQDEYNAAARSVMSRNRRAMRRKRRS